MVKAVMQKGEPMDLIERQAAIDELMKRDKALRNINWYDKPFAEGKCKGIDDALEIINALPSAQPEVIRCKDCKYWHREIHNGIEYFNFSSCDLYHFGDGHNFYCADAERRANE